MKNCPNCKAELDENARFCLHCMTSLEEKEQIPPPAQRSLHRWPLVLLCFLLLAGLTVFLLLPEQAPPESSAAVDTTEPSATGDATDPAMVTQIVDGVTYTFRPATKEEHPTAINLDNYYVLIRVEGTPSDGRYQVPSFVGSDMRALVTVVADGAFAGTDAKIIDLGYNVCYVWGDALSGEMLTDLYLHEDVLIDEQAFSRCTEKFTIHCPEYLENTEGFLWADLATAYGFQWQPEIL